MQQKINLTQVICLRMGKTTKAKPHQVNLRSLLSRIRYYHNKRLHVKKIPVPNINLQFYPYPNTQLDLFCSDNLSFSIHGSQYVTNQSINVYWGMWALGPPCLLVQHTYCPTHFAFYIKDTHVYSVNLRNTIQSFSISNMVSEPLL